jgi:hypothetical protein
VGVSFLTPWAGAVGLLALTGIAVLALSERRSRRLCAVLGIAPRRVRSVLLDAGGILAVGLLLGLGAAQPVVSKVQAVDGRTDVEVITVFDVSRSMLAQPSRSGDARLERAREFAKELRTGLVELDVGVASLTDRLLPHLFPTLSATAFTATVDRSVGIERPPPERRGGRATAFAALGDLRRQNFYSARARTRIAVVLTDGETLPFNLGELRALLLEGGVAIVFVQFWRADERVYGPRGAVESYRPDPRGRAALDRLAAEVAGRVFTEHELGPALAAVRRTAGTGPVEARARELRAVSLTPYAVGAAFIPLALVLLRRNL